MKIINKFAVRGCFPDVTFLMKLDPSVGKSRIKIEEQDRLELEKIEYHNQVFKAYLELEKLYPERIIGIDATGTIGEIGTEIRGHIEKLLK
ncbi:MAG: hypothetical protein RRY25_00475 [Anaerovorax sp.]